MAIIAISGPLRQLRNRQVSRPRPDADLRPLHFDPDTPELSVHRRVRRLMRLISPPAFAGLQEIRRARLPIS